TFDGEGAELVLTVLADGQHLIAGTTSKTAGVKVSDDGGLTWKDPAFEPQMACVGQRANGGDLFACGHNWSPDRFALGRSSDFGQSWSKIVRFVELDGELECPADSKHALRCSSEWPMWEGMFG